MKARFYDGITSHVRNVSVSLSSSYITITAEQRAFEFQWLYQDMMIVSPCRLAVAGKLGNVKSPDARLIIADEKTWKTITAKLKASQNPDLIPATWRSIAGLTAMTVAALFILVLFLPRILEGTAYILPDRWTDALGKNAIAAMVTEPVCTGEAGMASLGTLRSRLQSAAGTEQEFKIIVADNKRIKNAFTFPGGYIVIYSGLLIDADAPEIAGVLAHEMGHGVLGHAKRGLMRSLGLNLTASMVFGDNVVAGLAAQLSDLRFNREEEHEADRFAAMTLMQAGIDPEGLSAFLAESIQNAKAANASRVFSFFSTHPASADRIEKIRALSAKQTRTFESPLSEKEWDNLKTICMKTGPLSSAIE